MSGQNSDSNRPMPGETEAWFRDIVEHAGDLIQCVDSKGRFIYVNQTWRATLGYSADEVAGLTLGDVIHPDSREHCMAAFEQTLAGTAVGAVEATLVTKDGAPVMVEGKVSVKLDENNRFVHTRGIFRDVTARKKFEQQLFRSEERFQKMLALVPDMISIHDPDMNIVYSNWSGFAAVPEERRVLNTRCYRTYRGRDDICPDCQAITVLRTREAFQKEMELPEGVWVDLHVIPILGEDGSVELVVEWVRDITIKKQAERDRQNLVENAPDMIVRFNTELQHVYCNAAVEHYLGLPAEYFLGKTFADLAGDMGEQSAHLEQMNDILERCLETGKEQQVELCVQLQGEEKYYSTRVVPELSGAGRVESLLSVTRDTTERKKVEISLQKREEDLRTTLSSIGDAVITTCAGGYVTRMNPVAEKLTGWSHQGAVGQPLERVFRIVNNRTREPVANPANRAMQTGQVVGLANHTLLLARDGSEYQIADSASPIRDDQGNITGVVLVFRDVTHAYKLQQDLRESEAQKNAILNGISTNVALADPELRILWANRATVASTGKNLEDILGHTCYSLWGDPSHPCPDCPAVKAFQSGQSEQAIMHNVDGRVWEEGAEPILDDAGQVVAVVEIARDITERKQAEEALRQSEEHLSATLRSIGDGVIACDGAGAVVNLNLAAEKLTGWSTAEAAGKPIGNVFRIINAKTREKAENPVFRALRQGVIVNLANHTSLISKDGTERHIADSCAPIRDAEGAVTGAVLVFRDVTEEYESRAQLARAQKQTDQFFNQSLHGFFFCMLDEPIAWNDDADRDKLLEYVLDNQRMTRVNKAMLDQYGATEDDFIGITVRELFHHDLDHAREVWRGLFDRGNWHVETLEQKMDGTPMIIDGDYICLYDDQGRITGHFGVQVDITEQKQTTERLSVAEQNQRILLNNIQTQVWFLTNDHTYGAVNKAHADFIGLQIEDLAFKNLYDFLPEDVVEVCREGNREVFATGKPVRTEEWVPHFTGEQRVLSILKSPRLRADGTVEYVVCSAEDITEQKKAEEALIASEQKHREILATMEESYYEVDLAGNLVFFNESFCRLTGYSEDELMGKSYKKIFEDPQEVFSTFRQVYETGKPVTAVDWSVIAQDGRIGHLELSVALRRDEKGEPVGFRGVIRDITERRRADEKIRYLSYHDQLTGLYNRHFLEREMKRLDTERQLPISVIMADLNGLKLVNDTYGHHCGDEMLKKAASILKGVCRADDLLARFGGDEFVLYLPQTPENDAHKVCRRIEQACCRELINEVPLSLSTGLAVKASAGQKLDDLLKEAEDNMYRDKLTESRSGKSAIVNSLLQTLAAKSYETETHTRNMQEAANSIGEKLGLPHSELHRLQLLITLHDIGKINIPEELLTKKESLSSAEWEIVKKHSETGYRIAKATESFSHVAEDILAHHERWDGSGYPQGLKGEKIPLLSRITAMADAYEVMSNGRPYKKAMGRSEIAAEFKRCSGSQFDPELVELFLPMLEADG